ncbi:Acyl-CoA N-acyltransferase [Penicillium odoratum]|uniref:Acyl-CoA N-acyltransferase n=1 Tax=Penicillium odoratum TaxID=1167516 RepID=UPI002549595D|nr:Acyl-CoA N-acyltransferase [Penicillium odoratum]KAJ5761016.1 Acyl-CoA N-acyltransferase [Penicillium odoratum]
MSHVPSNPTVYQLHGQMNNSILELKSNTLDLSLRIPTLNDIVTLKDILTNKANSEFDKSISDATAEDLESIAKRWTTVSEPPTYRNFLVWHENKPIGIAGLGWIGPYIEGQPEDAPRAGAAGVIIQPFARGRGLGYEALRIVFDYGFCELGLQEIRVGSHSGNIPMRALMEQKFGLNTEILIGTEVDQFGNDLKWTIQREDWQHSPKPLIRF